MRKLRNEYQNFVGRPLGRHPLRRPRIRWKDKLKMNGNEDWEDERWIKLVQVRA
jgi:hypothetical protein